EYSIGQLIDLSQTGALIQLEHALYLNTQLSLTVETNDEALEMILEVVRVVEPANYDQYTYGCVIKDIIDF
ncbi:MAG: PilZ domain-containing protein, partial [Gammaproteobacteria bacterium]